MTHYFFPPGFPGIDPEALRIVEKDAGCYCMYPVPKPADERGDVWCLKCEGFIYNENIGLF